MVHVYILKRNEGNYLGIPGAESSHTGLETGSVLGKEEKRGYWWGDGVGLQRRNGEKEKVLLTDSSCFLRGRKIDFWVLLDSHVFFFKNEEKETL